MNEGMVDVRGKLKVYEKKRDSLTQAVIKGNVELSELMTKIERTKNEIQQVETYIKFCHELLGEKPITLEPRLSITIKPSRRRRLVVRPTIKDAICNLLDLNPKIDYFVADITEALSKTVSSSSQNFSNVIRNNLKDLVENKKINFNDEDFKNRYWSIKRTSLPFNNSEGRDA